MNRRASQAGIDLIKTFEGLRLEAYRDVAGVLTIGYGHTAGFNDGRFEPASVIAPKEAEALLREDLTQREANLNVWAIVNDVGLSQNEFDALISFIFNVGFAAFERSTAAKRLIAKDYPAAAEALTRWNKASVNGEKIEVPGLTRRRAAERALFLAPPGDE